MRIPKKKANTPQQLSFGMSGDLDMVHSRPEWGINENNSSQLGIMRGKQFWAQLNSKFSRKKKSLKSLRYKIHEIDKYL